MEQIRKILVRPDDTIKHALRRMDDAGCKLVFVSDAENRLVGALSDGDVRRWILKGGSISVKAEVAMNRDPKSLPEDYSKEAAKKLVLHDRLECIPIVGDGNIIKGAVWWFDFFNDKLRSHGHIDLPVVVMAGGRGQRLAPITNILPKPLMPIGNKPISQHIIERFVNAGSRRIYMSLNFKAKLIKAYYGDVHGDYRLSFIEETKPLGTAGSLYLLKGKLRKTFFLTNCDVLIDADYSDIAKFHKDCENKITIVGSMKHFTIPYGTCEIAKGGNLLSVHEKPEYDFLVITGMYILEPDVLSLIPNKTAMHMTELIDKCLSRGVRVGVYPISEKSWLDTGQWEQLQETLQRFENAK